MHGAFNRLFDEVQALFLANKFIIGTHLKGDKKVLDNFQSFFDRSSNRVVPTFHPHHKLTDIFNV